MTGRFLCLVSVTSVMPGQVQFQLTTINVVEEPLQCELDDIAAW